MARPDPFLNLLKDSGFLPIRIPREDVQPLMLLSQQGKDLTLLGNIGDALRPPAPPRPRIWRDIRTAANIQQTRTSKIDLSVGLSILTNIVAAISGKSCDLSAGFQQAATIVMEFAGVVIDRVDIVKLDRLLSAATIDPNCRAIHERMVKDECGIITAVMRCSRYLVTAQSTSGEKLSLDVPLLQNLAGGNVRVSASSDDDRKVTYEGPVPLAFGIQAVRVFYDNSGRFTAFDPVSPGSAALRGFAGEVRSPRLITVEGAFARIAA